MHIQYLMEICSKDILTKICKNYFAITDCEDNQYCFVYKLPQNVLHNSGVICVFQGFHSQIQSVR